MNIVMLCPRSALSAPIQVTSSSLELETVLPQLEKNRVWEERAGAEELEGSSLVLEKDDSEDYRGDQEERSSDIMSHMIHVYSWYMMS